MLNADQLRKYPLFSGLSDDELAKLAPCLTKRQYAKGAYLFHPGSPVLNMYVVESGLVRAFFTNSHGEEFMLDLIGPRSAVGLPLMREDQTRMLGASAVTPLVSLVMAQQDLIRFSQRSPQLMRNVSDLVHGSMEKLLIHIRSLVTLGVNGRLAGVFLYLSRSDGDLNVKTEIDLPLSQTDLANWIGASRGHLNRAISHLEESGLICVQEHKLVILDRPGLERASEELLSETM